MPVNLVKQPCKVFESDIGLFANDHYYGDDDDDHDHIKQWRNFITSVRSFALGEFNACPFSQATNRTD